MITRNLTIELISKINPSIFAKLNAEVISADGIPLGTSHSAVKKMVVDKPDMMKVLMPSVLSISPNDPLWYAKVKNYWDSFGIRIPIGGRKLEIGLRFDINDSSRKSAIQTLIHDTTKQKGEVREAIITDDNTLADYVSSNVTENEQYLYGHPINVEDYLIWQFCLGHAKVANDSSLMSKSENIDFVLLDPRKVEAERRNAHLIGVEAKRAYLEILSDRQKVKDILFIIGKNAFTLQDIDADIELEKYALSNPTKFVEMCKDESVKLKARIERYIIKGVLRKIPNSSMIVDASDATCVIGQSLDEAVAYFSAERASNQAKVADISARYKALSK